MGILDAILLGAVQGLTEFLPISSSGHLVLVLSILKAKNTLSFDIAVHLASLFAIFIFFNREIKNAFLELKEKSFFDSLLFKIIIGSVPAGVAGIFLNEKIEALFKTPKTTIIFLYLTAFLLILAEIRLKKTKIFKQNFSHLDALTVGVFQALAILPGVSRSGSTISAGILSGHSREESARFSFLLVIPAVLGAFLIDFLKSGFQEIFTPAVIFGFLSSLLFSLIALKILFKILKKYSLYPFAIYCILVATLFLLFG